VRVDPYGPKSPEFVVTDNFADMWTSALAFCQKRFEGQHAKYRSEPSGGIGCFTPDSFPVFDRFRENVYVIADSNHGYKMLGVGRLVAGEIIGTRARCSSRSASRATKPDACTRSATARSRGADDASSRVSGARPRPRGCDLAESHRCRSTEPMPHVATEAARYQDDEPRRRAAVPAR
jgi:hypothetical protein